MFDCFLMVEVDVWVCFWGKFPIMLMVSSCRMLCFVLLCHSFAGSSPLHH